MNITLPALVLIGTCLSAHSAVIAFTSQTFRQTDETIVADTSWVTTTGTLYGAKNVAGSTTTLNGVTFTGASGSGVSGPNGSLSQPSVAWSSSAAVFFNEGGGNAANGFLNTAGYNSGPQALQFSGLTVGNTYTVDMVFADTRSGATDGRYVNVSGTVVSGTLVTDYGTALTNQQFAFGSGDAGFLVIKASFVADAATQDISIRTFNANATSAGGQLNAFQIRDQGVIPEPSCALLGGLGLLALLRRRRSH